jgi:hypothetical protein
MAISSRIVSVRFIMVGVLPGEFFARYAIARAGVYAPLMPAGRM